MFTCINTGQYFQVAQLAERQIVNLDVASSSLALEANNEKLKMNYAEKIIKYIDEIESGNCPRAQTPSDFKFEMEQRGVHQGKIYEMSTHTKKYPKYAKWLVREFSGDILVGGKRYEE